MIPSLLTPAQTLYLYAGMAIWLLPCAIQDYRTHEISRWLTIPLIVLGLLASLLLNTFMLALAVFVGFFFAYMLDESAGPADGKIAVGVAGLTPLGLLAGVAISALAFLFYRVQGKPKTHLPAAVAFYLGVVVSFLCLAGSILLKAHG